MASHRVIIHTCSSHIVARHFQLNSKINKSPTQRFKAWNYLSNEYIVYYVISTFEKMISSSAQLLYFYNITWIMFLILLFYIKKLLKSRKTEKIHIFLSTFNIVSIYKLSKMIVLWYMKNIKFSPEWKYPSQKIEVVGCANIVHVTSPWLAPKFDSISFGCWWERCQRALKGLVRRPHFNPLAGGTLTNNGSFTSAFASLPLTSSFIG